VAEASAETKSTRLRWKLAAAAMLLAAAVALIVVPGPIARFTGYRALTSHSMGLIDETLQRDQATFLVITAIKTSLAVIEGSTIGVGFQLEIGDIAQPAYDYVDFFWEMFLYAFLVMGFYKILLETGLLELGFAFAGIGLGLLAVSLVAPARQAVLWRWGKRALLGGLLFTYAVPIALVATNALADRYLSAIRDQHVKKITSLENELDTLAIRFTLMRSEINLLQPGESFEKLKEGMLGIVRQAGATIQSGLTAFLYYILVIAFEIIFFPFASAYILYKFGQLALGRMLPPPVADAEPAANPSTAN
jgi:hypothetical protein